MFQRLASSVAAIIQHRKTGGPASTGAAPAIREQIKEAGVRRK